MIGDRDSDIGLAHNLGIPGLRVRADGELAETWPAVVRELHMDRATPLVDFAGRRTTSADFSNQMQARFAPTVMFHGPDGTQLAEAIVGYRLADFYGAYLERAIEESRDRIKSRQ